MKVKRSEKTKRLSSELLRKIKKLHFKSRLIAQAVTAGQHKSVFKGSGIEFEEVRSYVPGDDVRAIDWKVSARMGKPFIKRYKEERELTVLLLIDMSASGYFGTSGTFKTDKALEISALLAFNTIHNNDRIGAIFFTDTVENYIPPGKGNSHVNRILTEIVSFEPKKKGTDINRPLSFLGDIGLKKSVVFLISDFISDPYLNQLKVLKIRNECIGIILSDPGEFSLPRFGILSLKDPETGQMITLNCRDKNTRDTFFNSKKKQYDFTINGLKKTGIDCIEISTEDSVAFKLSTYFKQREKRFL